ncbi:SPX domain-containing protein 4 [Pyrus ussuriensis x Pyrus communis]|uniref:SPX domain-containing protein 4 n=1 Tax=Pyrus ussuriensis x Pyrus communis TaxID=2448454 RepID=A0A5N5GEQ7_9ROSA|nr:SPX domain-containing protein 4 [Pyrus ussuriensis x Pyrus communis]KAB2613843.1 SPX domain-containing protein 4 [Pyrus ussuriensis x Pyrus communis]
MKFGKKFRTHLEETLPEWRDKFLCYNLLKKLLKGFPATAAAIAAVDSLPRQLEPQRQPADAHPAAADGGDGGFHPLAGLQDWFVAILNEELEKLNDFYVDKEEEFVIRFQELKGRIESVKERSSRGGVFTSESEFSEEMMDIRKDFVTIHGEMVLLKNYSSLNFAGLVKILKKYDKRTGGVLRLRFTQLAVHQPFFTTEPLTRLVRECEANLELLFPLEAEIIEGTPTTQDETTPDRGHSNPESNDSANIASETPSNMEANMEANTDIYRGTVAAIKAIQGLQKPSSTSSPWSLSNHFRSQDEESTGAVTAENSTSNSVGSWQSEGEDDQL